MKTVEQYAEKIRETLGRDENMLSGADVALVLVDTAIEMEATDRARVAAIRRILEAERVLMKGA